MPKILTITQINEYIRGKLDEDRLLNQVAVRGEISNYKLYPSGHHYFTLKDEGAALKCVMFKGNAGSLRFRPEIHFIIIHIPFENEPTFRQQFIYACKNNFRNYS